MKIIIILKIYQANIIGLTFNNLASNRALGDRWLNKIAQNNGQMIHVKS